MFHIDKILLGAWSRHKKMAIIVNQVSRGGHRLWKHNGMNENLHLLLEVNLFNLLLRPIIFCQGSYFQRTSLDGDTITYDGVSTPGLCHHLVCSHHFRVILLPTVFS